MAVSKAHCISIGDRDCRAKVRDMEAGLGCALGHVTVVFRILVLMRINQAAGLRLPNDALESEDDHHSRPTGSQKQQ